jgi:hypothetical protein
LNLRRNWRSLRWLENMSARSTEHSDRPDYSGWMGEVAFVLLGEPTAKHDPEAGQGGGVLDLIVREKGDDHGDTRECFDANGIRITPDDRRNWQAARRGGAYG